ncbi:MAG: hypothetical protein ACI9Y1_003166 [Lentisphaeria bacterium]|jgi:hypothetical protein
MLVNMVLLGKEYKFCTLPIIHLMPEIEVNERMRKARDNARTKARGGLTAEHIARAHLIFYTNKAPLAWFLLTMHGISIGDAGNPS